MGTGRVAEVVDLHCAPVVIWGMRLWACCTSELLHSLILVSKRLHHVVNLYLDSLTIVSYPVNIKQDDVSS